MSDTQAMLEAIDRTAVAVFAFYGTRGQLLAVPVTPYSHEGKVLGTATLASTREAELVRRTRAVALLAEGSLYEECLMCPVHGGEFDARTGEAITLPAMEPLAVHDVRIDGDEIHVRLRSA